MSALKITLGPRASYRSGVRMLNSIVLALKSSPTKVHYRWNYIPLNVGLQPCDRSLETVENWMCVTGFIEFVVNLLPKLDFGGSGGEIAYPLDRTLLRTPSG